MILVSPRPAGAPNPVRRKTTGRPARGVPFPSSHGYACGEQPPRYTRHPLPFPSTMVSERTSFVSLGSDSDSDRASPASDSRRSDAGSGSDQGPSCPTTPAQDARHALAPDTPEADKELAAQEERAESVHSVGSDDTLGTEFQMRTSTTLSLYLPRASLPPSAPLSRHVSLFDAPDQPLSSCLSTNLPRYSCLQTLDDVNLNDLDLAQLARLDTRALDSLDCLDNRPDGDAIVASRLARNSLLRRISLALSARASEHEYECERSGDSARLSCASASASSPSVYDPTRVSVQTYGSSVLTYGSRASALLNVDEAAQVFVAGSSHAAEAVERDRRNDAEGVREREEGEDPAPPYDVPRPAHPLPWDPRPSALGRVLGTGRRPLPPIPTGRPSTSPSATARTGAAVSLGARPRSASASSGTGRRMRPLPKTPLGLSNIAEGGTEPSMSSPPFSASPSGTRVDLDSEIARTRGGTTIGYGHAARASVRGAFGEEGNSKGNNNVHTDRGNNIGDIDRWNASGAWRAARGISVRSAASAYVVPDVEELVRILDEMDRPGSFASIHSSSSYSSAYSYSAPSAYSTDCAPAPTNAHKREEVEELDIGRVLEHSRGCVAVPGGAGGPAAALEVAIGLPTPAATPRASRVHAPPRSPQPQSHSETLQQHSRSRAHTHPPLHAPPSHQSSTSAANANTMRSPTQSSIMSTDLERVLDTAGSPVLSSSGGFSLTSFPLPPLELGIPGPGALGTGVADGHIPPATAPSPSAVEAGRSLAERATLPGMDGNGSAKRDTREVREERKVTTLQPHSQDQSQKNMHITLKGSPPKPAHTRTRDAIADLKSRISALSAPHVLTTAARHVKGVQPVVPRHRAMSSASDPVAGAHARVGVSAVVDIGKAGLGSELELRGRGPPAIDVQAANCVPPPSAFSYGVNGGINEFAVGAPPCAATAPAHGKTSAPDAAAAATVVYATPSVAPLRLLRAASSGQGGSRDAAQNAKTVTLSPPSTVPQSASAAVTSFAPGRQNPGPPRAYGRAGPGLRVQRSASLSVSPSSMAIPSVPVVEPLRFRNSKRGARAPGDGAGQRMRSSTVSAAPSVFGSGSTSFVPSSTVLKASAAQKSEEASEEGEESDQLSTPTSRAAPVTPVAGACASCGPGVSLLSMSVQADESVSLDPAFADIFKTIVSASEEEQMGSLLTIASSINTDAGASFRVFGGASALEGDREDRLAEDKVQKAQGRTCVAGTSDERKSKGRSTGYVKCRASVVRAAIEALPDPSTFPVPFSAGSTATDASAAEAGADFVGFAVRPSPFPLLKVVTKFKGGSTASQAPLSAVSTKSTASALSSMSTYGNTFSARRASGGGVRKLNRLTLTDPRSPMADAAVAAAALVSRVRQKRQALALRGLSGGAARRGAGAGGAGGGGRAVFGHQRTGSNGTLRSKLKMTGSGFFGSSVRAFPDPVLRSGPRLPRPTVRRMRVDRNSARPSPSHEGSPLVDLCE